MSQSPNSDPRLDQAAASDESLLAAHEKLLGKKPDERAHYRLLPLNLLFVFSGLIFFAGTYLNSYSGHFDPRIYNEHALPHSGEAEVKKLTPEQIVERGKGYFNNAACNTCHQVTGLGQPGMFPPVAGSEWVVGSEERLIRIVLHGLQGKVTVKGVEYNSAAMPAFGKVAGSGFNWSDDKIAAVLTYIRQEWGNKAGPITPAQMTAARKEFSAKKVSWNEAEIMQVPEDAKLEGGTPAASTPSAPALSASTVAPPPTPSPAPSVPGSPDAGNAADAGKAGYMTICIACHQPTGMGLPGVFPSLFKSEYVNGSPERLTAMVLKGINPPFKYKDVTYAVPMVAQEAALTDDKIASILTFVRSSFENSAPPITTEFVAGVRKKLIDRKAPWTEAELTAWPADAK